MNANTPGRHSLLPGGWRSARLGEVMREAQGGFATGERDSEGVVQLRMNNVTPRGELDWSSFIRVPADSRAVSTYRLQSGDVLFNNTNSTELVGKTALFEGYEEEVVFSNHFTRLRTKPDHLEPRFLAFWLQNLWQRGVFAKICNRWIGQSAVPRDKLLALEILLPPISEQRRIAATVSHQLGAIQKAHAAAMVQLAAIDALPLVLLPRAFAGEL